MFCELSAVAALAGFCAVFVADAAELAEVTDTAGSLAPGDAVCPAAAPTNTHALATNMNERAKNFPRMTTSCQNHFVFF
jgi:hypothetical protein